MPMLADIEFGNLRSVLAGVLFWSNLFLLGIFGIYRAITNLKTLFPNKKLLVTPLTILHSSTRFLEVSRSRFLWAACLNPLDINISTAYTLWALVLTVGFLCLLPAAGPWRAKLLFIIFFLVLRLGVKFTVLMQYSRLYTQLAEVQTTIDERGIWWTLLDENEAEMSEELHTEDEYIAFTPWEKVKAVRYHKNYVILYTADRDYIYFVNSPLDKAILNTYFALSKQK